MFLNLLNIKAREGCTPLEVVKILYPDMAPLSATEMTLEAWDLKSYLQYGVLRRLCWLGLLYEAREGLTLLQDGAFHKTPLWSACLQLESDCGFHKVADRHFSKSRTPISISTGQ